MQIDLSGQIASESAGHRHVSGTGGQLQFVRGAFMSEGGKSFMCLSSRHRDKQSRFASRIVPGLSNGTVVTTPRTDAMYVVTEHGIANLKGLSVSERARLDRACTPGRPGRLVRGGAASGHARTPFLLNSSTF